MIADRPRVKPTLVRLPEAFGRVHINPWRIDSITVVRIADTRSGANERAVVRIRLRDHTVETRGLPTEDAAAVLEAVLKLVAAA